MARSMGTETVHNREEKMIPREFSSVAAFELIFLLKEKRS